MYVQLQYHMHIVQVKNRKLEHETQHKKMVKQRIQYLKVQTKLNK